MRLVSSSSFHVMEKLENLLNFYVQYLYKVVVKLSQMLAQELCEFGYWFRMANHG